MLKKGLNCLALVLVVFGATYMGLVFVYKLGNVATILSGVFFLTLGLILLLKSANHASERRRNYYGIFSGLFLWAVFGEIIEHFNILSLPDWHELPILFYFIFLIIYFGIKKYLPSGIMFSLGHFSGIWFLHFYMVNQFNILGRYHWSTYISAGIFLLLSLYFGFKMSKAKTNSENMAYSLSLLLSAWTILEYIWGWRLLPGPWSIH